VPVTLVVTGAANVSQTVTLQDGVAGYNGTRDVSLSSLNIDSNFGASTTLALSPQHVELVHFKVFASEGGPVPNGATITSAQLSFYKSTNAYDGFYAARRLLVPWTESEATWTRPRIGATWLAGGASGNGTDVVALWDATAAQGWYSGWIDFDVKSSLQEMSQSGLNFGWRINLVMGDQSTRALQSREGTTASLRPKLTVTYTHTGQ
jgi:hypothetical protein